MGEINQHLFKFAFFPEYEKSIKYLAEELADKEEWNYSTSSKNNYPILKSYLEFTFRKLKQEKKVVYTSDNKFSCFNTGLVTSNLENIYAFFIKYRNPRSNSSPYFFKAFLKESDNQLLEKFSDNLPDIANYFDAPELLIYNPKLKLIVNYDHIIQDNINRFPSNLQAADNREVLRQLIGSINEIKKLVRTNYKIAVPQYYNGNYQLLLPLNLTTGSSNPDLALVVHKLNSTTYTARTCLTLRMAYTTQEKLLDLKVIG